MPDVPDPLDLTPFRVTLVAAAPAEGFTNATDDTGVAAGVGADAGHPLSTFSGVAKNALKAGEKGTAAALVPTYSVASTTAADSACSVVTAWAALGKALGNRGRTRSAALTRVAP